jgi:hypothetical protein
MKIYLIFALSLLSFYSVGQVKLDDFGRIVLNTFLSEKTSLPSESKKMLETKLNQIASNNGMGGSQVNPRFVITAVVNVGTKDIIPGPPEMVAQNLELVLFIGDAVDNIVFSNTSISIKGVGVNENKAFIDAIKNVNPKNKEITSFIGEAKNKIVDYYKTQCNFLIEEALNLNDHQQFDEAIYKLSLVPEVCEECYFKCLDTLNFIFQQKINTDCKIKLSNARNLWIAEQNLVGAEKAGDVLSSINPMSDCQPKVENLIKEIDLKLKADEKARWDFKIKQYSDKIAEKKEQVRIAEEKGKRDDIYREKQSQRDAILEEKQSARNYELDKITINSCREIALAQAKNQPKTITYNNINWR